MDNTEVILKRLALIEKKVDGKVGEGTITILVWALAIIMTIYFYGTAHTIEKETGKVIQACSAEGKK